MAKHKQQVWSKEAIITYETYVMMPSTEYFMRVNVDKVYACSCERDTKDFLARF